ncbi:MAG: serine/threonine protein kinase [Alphaproteobacteria bacterium]|nr:MAG: serine/threonine protein kinase [Alphaproteobacteria bacterium]
MPIFSIGSTVGKYQIINFLGSGHFGAVYHAHDMALDCQKAIKILDVSDPADFISKLDEAQFLKKCEHQNVVRVNEANAEMVGGDLKAIIDMEYLPKGSVQAAMEKGFVRASKYIRYMTDVTYGIENAHRQGILHRDIKPGNILISGGGAKISDFGLATMLSGNSYGSSQSYRTHSAPEVANGGGTSIASDVFAAGMTLFRLANQYGDWNSRSKSIPDYLNHIRAGTLATKVGYRDFVPSKIRRIINRAINPDISKRFSRMVDFRQKLEKLSIDFDWAHRSVNSWTCTKNGVKYEIRISQNSPFTFDLLKNGRRNRSESMTFASYTAAAQYLQKYVAKTTFS